MKKSQLIKIIKEEITKVISESATGPAPTMSAVGKFQPKGHPGLYKSFTTGGALRVGTIDGQPAIEVSVFANRNMTPDPKAKIKVDSFEVVEREALTVPLGLLSTSRPENVSTAIAQNFAKRSSKITQITGMEKVGFVGNLVTEEVRNLLKSFAGLR